MKRISVASPLMGLVLLFASLLASVPVQAQQAPVAADVIVVMDESGSMSGEQRWSAEMIPLLDTGLQEYGIGSEAQENAYGLVGFGNSAVVPRTVQVEGDFFGSPGGFVTAAGQLRVSGGTEDGWRGIEFALDQYPRRNGAAVNIILVTDEDRDNTLSSVTYASVLQKLNDNGALLNAVVNARMYCGSGARALGMDSLGTGYVADGSGGFTTCEGAYATSGSGQTIADYVDLAIENGGAAWDLSVLRSGGMNARSFSSALLAIKIDEILNQRPTGDLVAVVQATPNPAVAGETITLDGTGSFHQKEGRVITSWDWDLDNDGRFDASGPVITTRFDALGDYPVTLRVTDDSETPLMDTTRVVVNVSTPPLQPTANSGGPYLFCPQTQPWYLDGSGSVNPDDGLSEEGRPADAITAWDWDLNNDLVFDDASGPRVDVSDHFSTLGTGDYLIRLRVTDNTAAAFPSSGRDNLVDTSVTRVQVRDESDAACNCLTDVAARPNMQRVQLTWSDTGAHAYGIYRSEQEGGPYERIAVTDNRYSTYLDLGIELNTPYYYAVSELGTDGRDLCRSREVSVESRPRGASPSNRPPVIESAPVLEAIEGQVYRYTVVATDPDPRDRIDFSLQLAPGGMTINSQSGQIEWTPLNAHVGTQAVIVRAADSQGAFAEQVFEIVVTNLNQPPRIVSEPELAATELQSYHYPVQALDPDLGDQLAFFLEQAPAGMEIDEAGGLITWNPVAGQAGSHPVTVKVTDQSGESDIQTFVVQVEERNHLPVITSIPVTLASVGAQYRYGVTATDDNQDDTLTFSLGVFPDGMAIDPLTGEILWTPQPGQEGIHAVAVVVSDTRGGSTSQNYQLVVSEQNLAPVILTDSLPDATRGQAYRYTIAAEDANGDELTFALVAGPSNMVIGAETGEIAWLPVQSQVGMHTVRIRVSDNGGMSAEAEFNLQVFSSDHAPSITSIPSLSAMSGQPYHYLIRAENPDGGTLSYFLIEGPAGMTLGHESGELRWTPDSAQQGPYSVKVRVEDESGAFDEQSFEIVVSTDGRVLEITSTPVTSAQVGSPWQYQVTTSDSAGGELVIQLTTAPAGMSLASGNLVSWTPEASDEGGHPVTLQVVGEGGFAVSQSFILTVFGSNPPPVITSEPPTAARVGQMYAYQVVAERPLAYSLVQGPAGMTLSSGGTLLWVPGADQEGVHEVSLQGRDAHGATVLQTFSVTVRAENRAPVFEGVPATSARVGEPYLSPMTASDPDGDSLTWSLISAPAGMSIHPKTGEMSWIPQEAQIGLHEVAVRVSDGQYTIGRSYSITVVGDMPPPMLGNTPPQTAELGKQYIYRVVAIDGQGYSIIPTLVSGPEGMTLTVEDGLPTIRWVPSEGDCVKTVDLRLEDQFGQVSDFTWNIQVYSAPRRQNRIQCSIQSEVCGG